MRRLALSLLLVIGVWSPLAADETRPYAEGLLWRIDGAAAAPSYVFGTVHVTDARVQAVVNGALATVGRLDSISLEALKTPAALAEAGQRMVSMTGPNLSDRIGAELFAATAEIAANYGLNAAILQRFQPWAVAVTLSVPVSELRAQAAGKKNAEDTLQAYAEANAIALHGIESYDEQLSMFEQLDEAAQVEMLRLAVLYNDVVDALFAQMVDAYLARDLNRVYDLMEEQAAGNTAELQAFFEEDLIVARNHRMAERIQPRLAEGNAFIAVGALHLPDEEGLLRLLERRGYTVTRLDVPG